MATYNRPGVYINEFPLLAEPQTAAATANAAGAVIGAFPQGTDLVTRVTSWAEFSNKFGGYNRLYPATFGVGSFFRNGGVELWVKRIFPASSKKVAKVAVSYTGSGTGTLCTIAAKNRGVDGNNIRLTIIPSRINRTAGYYDIAISYYDPATNLTRVVENFNGVVFHDPNSGDYAPNVLSFGSAYINILEGVTTEYDDTGAIITPSVNYSVSQNIGFIPNSAVLSLAGAPETEQEFTYGDYTGNTVYNPVTNTGSFTVNDCAVFKEFETVDQPLVFFLPDVVGRVANTATGTTSSISSVAYTGATNTAVFTSNNHPFLQGEDITVSGLSAAVASQTATQAISGGVTAATTATLSSANAGIYAGMTVTASSGTISGAVGPVYVASVNTTALSLSQNITISSGATLVFTPPSVAFLNTTLKVTAVDTNTFSAVVVGDNYKRTAPTAFFYDNTAKTATFTVTTGHPILATETVTFSNLAVAVSSVTTTNSSAVNASTTVPLTSNTGVYIGMRVTASAISGNVYVVTVGSNTMTVSQALTLTNGSTLLFVEPSVAFLNAPLTVNSVTATTVVVAVPNGGVANLGVTGTTIALTEGTGTSNVTSNIPATSVTGVIGSFDVGAGWPVAKEVYKSLLAWVENSESNKRNFVVIETAPNIDVNNAVGAAGDLLLETTGEYSSRGAVYYPHIFVKDALGKSGNSIRKIGPSGAVAGLYLDTDRAVGPFKTPAGIDTQIRDALAIERLFSPTDLDQLNSGYSLAGINVSTSGKNVVNAIRNLPGAGIVVMGGRTLLQDGTANRYVNMRRSLIHIEKRLNDLATFAVFENNTEALWGRLITTFGSFLNEYRNQGGLRGSSPEQSFFIKCDEENNTAATMAAGEVNIEVGVALEYPAEFIIINLSQKTAE